MLTFQDCDLNTGLHFGARNGNFKICSLILDEAARVNCILNEEKNLDLITSLVNCRNTKGLTPLLSVAYRGYKSQSTKEGATESRHLIVKKLLEYGANPNYCKPTNGMTALHWLAYNNDDRAIKTLLEVKDGDGNSMTNHLVWTYDENLPVDIAGSMPSYAALDTLLEHYSTTNNLHKP